MRLGGAQINTATRKFDTVTQKERRPLGFCSAGRFLPPEQEEESKILATQRRSESKDSELAGAP